MLEEYQSQAQQVQDLLDQSHTILDELNTTMQENYPPEERTYRMGQAMSAVINASNLVLQAHTALHDIEWPTEERPR